MSINAEVRIHEIDGLRGIAILSVFIYHVLVLPSIIFLPESGVRILTLSAYGVDLFFVISGFLIGNIFLKMQGLAGIGTFYIRRIFRIWPLYYFLLLLVYLILSDKSRFADVPYWSFFFFIFNYWESFGREMSPALLILWSIAIEEQFYLIGPIAFSIFSRKRLTFLLILCIVLSPLLRLALSYYTDIILWRFTPARIDGLCIGLLLSIFLSSRENMVWVAEKVKSLKFLTLVLLLSLIPCVLVFSDHFWASFGHSLIVLAFGSMLLLVQVQSFLGRQILLLSWPFLRYLGLRCYSIYLFHGLFNIIVVSIFKNIYIDFIVVSILTVLFAHVSWRYMEMPLIRLGRRFSYGVVPN